MTCSRLEVFPPQLSAFSSLNAAISENPFDRISSQNSTKKHTRMRSSPPKRFLFTLVYIPHLLQVNPSFYEKLFRATLSYHVTQKIPDQLLVWGKAFRCLIFAKLVTAQVLCLDSLYTKVALLKFWCYLWLVTKKGLLWRNVR